ncbi:MAG TPA: hypothetical protein VKH18_01240 [Terriglobales bacterium]|nr:hypothetical protein [Terriglobales bacterium]
MMPSPKSLALLILTLALVLFAPQVSWAQYTISTVAGGGPGASGVAELNASIGYPGTIAFDTAGNAYIADIYSSRVLKVNPAGIVTAVAGNDTSGYSGDGGPATSAALSHPIGVAVDSAGNVFIADTGNSVIREVVASTGNIQTVAGNGVAGYSGDGSATSVELNEPFGVSVDGSGNIFIADTSNCLVRKVSGGALTTIAGNPTLQSPCGYSGDGPATTEQLSLPEGVFVDGSGNVFIADTDNSLIRELTGGNIQTVVGTYYDFETSGCNYSGDGGPPTAANAYLCAPSAVFVDSSGDIFIADTNNVVIREVVAAGDIETVAGNNADGPGYSGDTGPATSAQLNYPNDMYVDSAGDIFIADTDNFVIREVTAGTINTVIGNNTLANSGDGGPAVDAQLNYPGDVFVDGSGNIFIADSVSSVIREVSASSSDIQTAAGDAKTPCTVSTNLCGDGGTAASAQFNNPYGVAVDGTGNIYIADTGDNRIRVVTAGNVATVAGTGNQCTAPFAWPCGDGAAAISAELFSPLGVAVDSAGNLFIADTDDHAIRVVNMGSTTLTLAGVMITTGQIATVAGNGTQCQPPTNGTCGDGGPATSAQLNFPGGLFVDSSDNIYIADTGNNRVRVVNTGTATATIAGVAIPAGQIATVAGTGTEGYAGDGALATAAQLAGPSGVFVDGAGDIFISDTNNFVVREVVASTWEIATIAGNNTQGFSGDGGLSTSAQFANPLGMAGDSNGNLYVADTDNSRIRELVVTVMAAPSASAPAPQTASPGGTATYDIQLKADTGDPRYAITLSCLQSSLPANATCSFSPATITPGPLAVPFTLRVTVPTTSSSIEKPSRMRLQLVFAVAPLAGILLAGAGLRRAKRRWLLLVGLAVALVLLNACGGGNSMSGSGTTYNVQVQGTWKTQANPVTITTATLIVQSQ